MRARTTSIDSARPAPLSCSRGLCLGGCETIGRAGRGGHRRRRSRASPSKPPAKTVSDHLVSAVTGEDCSVLRYTKNGKYCLTECRNRGQISPAAPAL